MFRRVWKVFIIILGFSPFLFPFPLYATVLHHVPFTSQAPFGNWISPWQDFCEEASVVMAAHFLRSLPLSPRIADLEMHIIKRYEELVFGRHKDTSIEETAQILRVLYGFRSVEVREVRASEDIKRELRLGRVIIAPVAGRILANPYYKSPGPLYHMVVVRGFDDMRLEFVVNDPGTIRGNGFRYPESQFFEAIHDWNQGDVYNGKKMVLMIWK